MRCSNFVNFSYNQKSKTYFANINTATVSPKYKTIGTTKQTPKPSRIITEMNANVEHAFTVLNSTKNFFLLVLFKNRAKVTLVNAIQTIRRHY